MSESGNREQGIGTRENEFEAALTQALQYVEAPAGFAQRMMARAAQEEDVAQAHVRKSGHGAPRTTAYMTARPMWRALPAMVAVVVMVAGVVGAERYEHRKQAMATAETQFEMSTRITDRALERAREQLLSKGVKLED